MITYYPESLTRKPGPKTPGILVLFGLILATAVGPVVARWVMLELLTREQASSAWGQGGYFVVQAGFSLGLAWYLARRYSEGMSSEPFNQRRTWLALAAAMLGMAILVGPFTYMATFIQWSFLGPVLSDPKPSSEAIQMLVTQLDQLWNNYYGWGRLYSLFFSTFMVLVVGPIWEETLHSLVLVILLRRMKPSNAVALAAIVFCLPHLLLPGINQAILFQMFVLFSLTGAVRCWSGNWLTSVIIHALANLVVMGLPLYLAVQTHLKFGG